MLQNVSALQSLILRRAFERSFACAEPLARSAKNLQFGLLKDTTAQTLPVSHPEPKFYEIRYRNGETRAFENFDFLREWNNRGDGNLSFGNSLFQLRAWQLIHDSRYEPWGEVFDVRSQQKVSDYLGVFRGRDELKLWCLRDVGPVDGFDWRFVEHFIAEEDVAAFGGAPRIHEVPAGFRAGVFMRIDCDEAIASGRPLFELYRERQMPFSMAIKTEQPIGAEDLKLISDVLQAGGSIVSHSHTHAGDWGTRAQGAAFELKTSQEIMKSWGIPGVNDDYAVSPFHQNSIPALKALQIAGLRGFIGGIACNDPEALLYRAGACVLDAPLVTISTQCMLHGDCYHAQGNRLQTEITALDRAVDAQKLFGFLDHPLSGYNYGWANEDERLQAHCDYLDAIDRHDGLWRPNLVQALDFTRARSQICLEKTGPATWRRLESGSPSVQAQFTMSMNGKTWSETL